MRRSRQGGLTLVEVIIAMAFISLIYGFVVQIFFQGFKNITKADVENAAAALAHNEMTRISSMDNPIYIGLSGTEEGRNIIEQLRAVPPKITLLDLVQTETLTLSTRTVINEETKENSEEIMNECNTRISYTRKTEWQIDGIEPVIVRLWVTVVYSDITKEFADGEFVLESVIVP
jgi:Tfp pilus assembly protein PilE